MTGSNDSDRLSKVGGTDSPFSLSLFSIGPRCSKLLFSLYATHTCRFFCPLVYTCVPECRCLQFQSIVGHSAISRVRRKPTGL